MRPPATDGGGACERCLRRSWLLARLAGHLELARDRIEPTLALPDDELIEAIGGPHRSTVRGELARFAAGPARERAAAAGVAAICRCHPRYPPALSALESPPATLYLAGAAERFLELAGGEAVAIVGARRASTYGLEVARSLGRGLASAGLCVVSGMAFGADSAAHAGALEATGATIAVLAGSPERCYPAAKRSLYRQILATGAVVSELPPGTAPRRWMFPARNRIIAALAVATIVVEARERSGALLTAGTAQRLGRLVCAVPGPITSPLSAGPNGLIAAGARLVQGPQDVLDHVFGAGERTIGRDTRPPLQSDQRTLLAAIGSGAGTAEALRVSGMDAEDGLPALADLELAGYLRRGPGGTFVLVP